MTRKRRDITDSDVSRWIDQGFGQGEGDNYRPWVKVRDVPSRGRSTRIGGLKFRRTHHLLSDVEFGHFLLADFKADVAEIREGIALLPREDTLRIAAELGVRHPTYPGTRTPVVMSSDLWMRFRQGAKHRSLVLSVKHEEALYPGAPSLSRTIEKLSIERRYWQERGEPWHLVTQSDYNLVVVRNLGLLRPSRAAWRSPIMLDRAQGIASLVLETSNAKNSFVDSLMATGWPRESAFSAFGLAVWKRWIPLDLRREQRFGLPIPLLGQE